MAPHESTSSRAPFRALPPHRMLGAILLTLGSCIGGPDLARAVQVQPGQRTSVRLLQGPGAQALTLQNASSGKAEKVYSNPASDPLTKVVTDAQLQTLLDVFAERKLFETALPTPPADARDALVVQQGERSWVFARRLAGLQQQEMAFHEAKSYFLSVWNGATAYHTSDIDRADLRAEQERVKTGSREAVQKLDPPGVRR